MSQFQQNPYAPMDPTAVPPRRTSGLAITALVFSLIGIIPCCGAIFAPIGLLLGLIGIAVLGPTAAKKGRGLATAAVIIALILCVLQGLMIRWGYKTFWVPVAEGPRYALEAAERGDLAGFKSSFYGPASSATDEECRAFIDEMHNRYGGFVSVAFDENSNKVAQPSPGQTEAPFPYVISFANTSQTAECEIVFADKQTGTWPMKPSYIIIFDSQNGDLRFPASATPAGSGSGRGGGGPSGGAAPGAGADDDDADDADPNGP